MKIAYISSPFLSDCDLPLIAELTKKGHKVTYLLQMSPSSRQATVINVPELKTEGGLFSATEYPALDYLKNYLPLNQVLVVNMPRARDAAPSSLRAVWQTYRFIKKGKFDVVQVTRPLRYGSFLYYAFRKRMVMTMHDPLPHSSDRNRLNRLHRWVAFRAVDHFIVLSSSLREEFVEKCHLQGKEVYVSKLGAYDILTHVRPEPMNLPQKYVLFAGSINPHKGIRYLCEAMRKLKPSHPDLHLVIAGRGEFDFDIDSYVAECQITLINRFVTDGELVTLIRRSEFVVCPYTDATQSGVIMSSFAFNKPVLATNVGALGEMLADGRHGLLVPPCDSEALATAISNMLRPEMLRRMAGNIASDYSIGDRSWADIARKTVEIYNNVK